MNFPGETPIRREVTDADISGIKTAMRDVSKSWQQTDLTEGIPPGSEAAFDAMADTFKHLVETHPATTERFHGSGPLESGYGILGRHFYAGALTGALRGYSLEEVRAMMFTPTSYQTVEYLTREINSSAKEIEFENGLRRITYSSIDNDPSRYAVADDGGLILKNYFLDRLRARMRLADEGRLSYEDAVTRPEEMKTNCKLNRLGGFATCYKAMGVIAITDPHLTAATLVRTDIKSPLTVE